MKENDLVHGEFGKWLESVEMSNTQASRFMKIVNEIPLSKLTDVGKISLNALYEIATLPEPEREKEHTLPSGETKTPDEMTVRELGRTIFWPTSRVGNTLRTATHRLRVTDPVGVKLVGTD